MPGEDGRDREEAGGGGVLAAAGLLAINETDPDDVFIVGYAKSGNTWFQNLVAGVVYGAAPEFCPNTVVQDLVPDVHYKRWYRRYGTPSFFKSHNLPTPDYRKVVYLLRDGRDVMVSYFRYLNAMDRSIDFMSLAGDGESRFPEYKWWEHVRAWRANPFGAEIITVRYEDLLADGVAQLHRFCEFVGVERSEEFLASIAAGASFSNMRRKELQLAWDNPKLPADKAFVRRGEKGSYKDEMPPEVLTAFLREAGDVLAECGYEDGEL
jgi:hypothetical protein